MSCNHSQEGEYLACIHCDIEHAGNEGYREGIAWEQKRIEIAWQVERFECQCETPMDHLLERIENREL